MSESPRFQPPANLQEGGAADTVLATRLRTIRHMAIAAAGVWLLASIAGTLWISGRALSGHMAKAAVDARAEAKAMSGVVDRMFQELQSVAKVLSSGSELRAVARRYSALREAFLDLPQEQRASRIRDDPDVMRLNQRLALICDTLSYSLIFVLDSHGIRIASSDWDSRASFLGERYADRKYFREAFAQGAGQMFVVGRTTKVPGLFFSARIDDGGGAIGVVVMRQDSDTFGSLVAAGGRHATLVLDPAGMVVVSSHPPFLLHHVGGLAEKRPDAKTLRDVYAQEEIQTLNISRPPRPMNDAEWTLDGRPYLANRVNLKTVDYSLLVLTPVDQLEALRPLHYVIGALAALFGLLVVVLTERALVTRARRHHAHLLTVALNEKLKAVNADKDRYLGIAAHDLRNPLSSTRGLAQLMLEMPLEPAQQREFLETIQRTSDEMLTMVNDLLDVAVIESGKLDLKRGDQDLGKLVQSRIRHLKPHASAKKMKLEVDTGGVQHASIDPARFGQVIDNLVSNAIKFSPPETTVEVALRSDGGSFTFSVQDQGPGIPEADRTLLFRSFQKLSARPTGGEKSTGLGLAIVKRIVDAHGGTIDVQSSVGSGSRFTVIVPLAPVQGGTS